MLSKSTWNESLNGTELRSEVQAGDDMLGGGRPLGGRVDAMVNSMMEGGGCLICHQPDVTRTGGSSKPEF